MGWRTTTARFPAPVTASTTRRVVWLFPAGDFNANGVVDEPKTSIMVASGPSSSKLAPAARTELARCITYSCDTSEYANTTSSTGSFAISAPRSSSGWIGMPFGYRGPARAAG